ncbi:hypothetical protein SAZ11_55340 [Streptomyces sp. FXJ1.4098]|nr:hypothetical protein [Streptomyces sp. FXJ1.4098]
MPCPRASVAQPGSRGRPSRPRSWISPWHTWLVAMSSANSSPSVPAATLIGLVPNSGVRPWHGATLDAAEVIAQPTIPAAAMARL